jgi:hypothetical protein
VLPLRIVVGLVFVVHGAQKLLGFGLTGTAGFLGSLGIPLPMVAAGVLIAVDARSTGREGARPGEESGGQLRAWRSPSTASS